MPDADTPGFNSYPDPAALIAQNTPPRSPNPPDMKEPTADQDKDENEGNYVSFPLPENFQPPEDAKPGKSFQALATLKLSDDGKTLNLVAVDGAPVKAEAEEPEGEEPENEGEPGQGAAPSNEPTTMADAMKQGLPATGMPA